MQRRLNVDAGCILVSDIIKPCEYYYDYVLRVMCGGGMFPFSFVSHSLCLRALHLKVKFGEVSQVEVLAGL